MLPSTQSLMLKGRPWLKASEIRKHSGAISNFFSNPILSCLYCSTIRSHQDGINRSEGGAWEERGTLAPPLLKIKKKKKKKKKKLVLLKMPHHSALLSKAHALFSSPLPLPPSHPLKHLLRRP